MEWILAELEGGTSWKEAMRKNCRQNKLNVDLVAYYTPLRFKAAHNNFLLTHRRKPRGHSERWLENELKAFYWICVALSCINGRKIAAFEKEDWATLHQVFPFKKPITLEYEALRMTVDTGRQVEWTQNEDYHLCEILKQEQEGSNKWNEFARQLYERSQRKFLRSGKQCRERWLNHLDPSKKHGDWSHQEDRMLIELMLKVGKRWSKVAKSLGNKRTEHMVKNRFKTIIGREKRLHPEITDQDILFKLFLQGDSCKEETTLVDSKLRDESPQIKQEKAREQSQPKRLEDENYRVVILQEVGSQDFKDLIIDEEDDEQKESPMVGTPRQPDLPHVYSPWFIGVPLTPTLSPNVSFFINVPNFSSYENNCTNSFYNPTRIEAQPRGQN